ncbi:unnamed protein product [Fusarium fujikuroi]|nr:unnamed protein product [Fusarium fujikuroi]
MEAQAENFQVLDLAHLDLALGFIPDAQSADVLRRQFVDACQTVERAEGRVRTLSAELKAQQEAFEIEKQSEREAIRKEKAILQEEQGKLKDEQLEFKRLAASLGTEVQKLSKSVDQVSDNVQTWGSTVAEATADKEKTGRQLNQDILTKLESLSATVETNTTDLSSTKDKSVEMATALESVKKTQKQIELSLKDGVTKETMKGEFQSFTSFANTIKESIEALPAVPFFEDQFKEVGCVAKRADHYEAQAMQLDRDIQTLREEARQLEDSTSHQVAEAQLRVEEANSRKDVAESRVIEKDSFINDLREANADLRNSLREAESQGNTTKRRLEVMEQKLETAEAKCREFAEVRSQLQRAEQAERQSRERTKDLEVLLGREKRYRDEASAELTKALAEKGEIIRQKAKLEDESSSFYKELTQLRSQSAMDLQRQLNDQWRTVKQALEKQLSDKSSHDESIRELQKAWGAERQALQGQITDKDSLLERKKEEVETLRSQASMLEPLNREIAVSKRNLETVTQAWDQAKSDLHASEERFAQSERRILASNKEIQEIKNDNDSLRADWEDALGQVKSLNAVIERIEREHQVTKDTLSTLQEQSVTVPQGVTGALSQAYLRLADEFRSIPIAPEVNGQVDVAQVAVEIGPLLIRYGKGDLLGFLERGSQDLHCSRQVIQGDRHSLMSDGTCIYHKRYCDGLVN